MRDDPAALADLTVRELIEWYRLIHPDYLDIWIDGYRVSVAETTRV